GMLVESGRRGATFGEFLVVVGVCYWMYRRHEAKKLARQAGTVASVNVASIGQMTTENRASATILPVQSAAPSQQPPLASRTRRRWQSAVHTSLYQPGSSRERLTQLVGSMLLSAVICSVVGLVVMMLRGQTLEMGQYAWLAASSTLGSW